MTVKELVVKLQQCNQDAKVSAVVHNRDYEFTLSGGGGGDGCPWERLPEISFYVHALNSREKTTDEHTRSSNG